MSDPRGIMSPPPVGGNRVEGASAVPRVGRRKRHSEEDAERRERRKHQGHVPPTDIPDDGQPHIDMLA
jgi:hypothetical protein